MSLDLLVHGSYPLEAWREAFAAAGPEAATLRLHGGPEAPPCDYALVWNPPAGLFASQPKLRAIFAMGAGVESLLGMPALPSHIPLIRLEDAGLAAQMAGYVCWGVLRHLRDFERLARLGRDADDWSALRGPPPITARIGIAGFGVLGRAVAEALQPHGFRLRAWRRSEGETVPGVDVFHGDAGFVPFLQDLDVLVCLLPHTPATENLIDAAALARLAPGALLINAGRGSAIDDEALLAALERGRPAAALLDVFREEPLPPAHPFRRHPAITLTPHIAARTQLPLSAVQVAQKIARLEAGLPVGGIVDRQRAY
ncbi:glyoxylate/hydroxypyruvate reductase A [Niveibacterium sp. SC-1]|uniref:2-hydroxyacid dehydrogenase n=1 Tax=Niveibacterium sp. SC-1 TaxID=3135646 RepID=UPI00311DE2E4